MSIVAEPTETTYALTAANLGPFSTVWTYEQASDVVAWLDLGAEQTRLSQGVDYTLAGVSPLTAGGAVTLSNIYLVAGAWPDNCRLVLQRAQALDQPSTYGQQPSFDTLASEQALDHVTREVQQLATAQGRALSAPPGDVLGPLPNAVARAGLGLGFDGGGNPIAIAPGLIVSALFELGDPNPTPGGNAGITYKWDEGSTPAENIGGYWGAPHPVYAKWAYSKEWTLANTGGAPSGSPAATLLTIARNKGTLLDSVGHLVFTIAEANGSSNFAQNLIATDDGICTGAVIRCTEMDWEASAGKSHTGFALGLNKFGDAYTCSAVYIQGFHLPGTPHASWSNAIVVGAAGYGLVADQDAVSGASLITLLDTNSGATYSGDALQIANGHRIRFTGTAGTNAAITNSGDYLRFIGGANPFAFRDNADTTTLFGIDGGGFAVGSGVVGAGWIANIGATGATEGANIAQFQNSTPVQAAAIFVATGAAGNAAACALRLRANAANSRSINAGGTINAAGADYAEYETKAAGCGVIAKGDLVGFDADGLLTDKFDLAISFGVKSTAPNLTGDDTWHLALGEPPIAPIYADGVFDGTPDPGGVEIDKPSDEAVAQAQAALDAGASGNAALKLQHIITLRAAYDARQVQIAAHATDRAAFEASEAARLAAWQAGPLAAYQAADAAYAAALEAARQAVDRIAYCGKVPVNVTGAAPGQFIAASRAGDGSIAPAIVAIADRAAHDGLLVGRVRKILPDGRAQIVVITQ